MSSRVKCQDRDSVEVDDKVLQGEGSPQIKRTLEDLLLVRVVGEFAEASRSGLLTELLFLHCMPDECAGSLVDHVGAYAKVFEERKTRLEREGPQLFLALLDHALGSVHLGVEVIGVQSAHQGHYVCEYG